MGTCVIDCHVSFIVEEQGQGTRERERDSEHNYAALNIVFLLKVHLAKMCSVISVLNDDDDVGINILRKGSQCKTAG